MRMELVFLEPMQLRFTPLNRGMSSLVTKSRVPHPHISAEWRLYHAAIQLPVNW